MKPFIIINKNNTIHEYIAKNAGTGEVISSIFDAGIEFFSPGWYHLTKAEEKHYEEFFSN